VRITAELSAALSGRYVVEPAIGRGGMAVVYLARDTKHDRLVAVKVLNPELGAMLGAERFLAEIRTTATLRHPNLLPLFDSGEAIHDARETLDAGRATGSFVQDCADIPGLGAGASPASEQRDSRSALGPKCR